jgi:hypothetical protein
MPPLEKMSKDLVVVYWVDAGTKSKAVCKYVIFYEKIMKIFRKTDLFVQSLPVYRGPIFSQYGLYGYQKA